MSRLIPNMRQTRRTRASALIVGAAAMVLLAAAHTSANAAEGSTRMVQVRHACAVVLGLDPSERPYDFCVGSLGRSLSEANQAQLVESDRSACAQKGLAPGASAFATCVVNAEQSPAGFDH